MHQSLCRKISQRRKGKCNRGLGKIPGDQTVAYGHYQWACISLQLLHSVGFCSTSDADKKQGAAKLSLVKRYDDIEQWARHRLISSLLYVRESSSTRK